MAHSKRSISLQLAHKWYKGRPDGHFGRLECLLDVQEGLVEVSHRQLEGVLGASVSFKRRQGRFAQIDSPYFGRFGDLQTRLGGVSEGSLKAIS